MQIDLQVAENKQHSHGYFVDIEGTVHSWPSETITTEHIIAFCGWPLSQGVIEIDRDNNERTLQPWEVVHLKPGHVVRKESAIQKGDEHARTDQERAGSAQDSFVDTSLPQTRHAAGDHHVRQQPAATLNSNVKSNRRQRAAEKRNPCIGL